MKNEEKVLKYLTEETGCEPEAVAPLVLKDLMKYDDIATEFLEWLDERKYRREGAVLIGGWTAESIAEEAPWLDGAGVFNFLVSLRDDPEVAKEIAERKFVV